MCSKCTVIVGHRSSAAEVESEALGKQLKKVEAYLGIPCD